MPIRMSTRMKSLIEDEGADGTLTFFCKHCNEGVELAVNREMLRNWALSSSQRGFRLLSINCIICKILLCKELINLVYICICILTLQYKFEDFSTVSFI